MNLLKVDFDNRMQGVTALMNKRLRNFGVKPLKIQNCLSQHSIKTSDVKARIY